ncbi:MAG TPA: MFS transporter, partial [Acidimicrobiales bacterium]|nr:MFS transporter [Acidimicrobiales bacterium]
MLGTAAGWTDGTVGPVSVPLAADLKVSLAAVGLLSGTVFFGACLVAAWTTPWATSRLGMAGGLRAACGLDVVGNLMCAVGPSFGWLVAGRILVGLGVGAVFVLAYVLARDRGGVRLMGTLGGSTSLGLALSLVVGGILADVPAWRASFAVTGALGVVALFLVPSTDLTDRPKSLGRIGPLLAGLLRPGTWLVLGVYLTATCTPLILGVWIVVYLSGDPGGLSPWLAGLFGGMMYFLTVLTRPIGGMAGQRSTNGWWLPALGLALAGGGLVGLALSRTLGPVIVSVAAIGTGFALPFATV